MSKYLVNKFKQIPFRRGKWIAPPNSRNIHNYYFRARNQFELYKIPDEPVLHIGAESSYVLYVNGTETGRGPARGTRRYNYYDSYDIKSLLHTGENIIAVLVQCMNRDTFTAVPAQPGLIVEVNGAVASNSTWEVCTAKDWRRDTEPYCIQSGQSEWRDLRLEPAGWTTCQDQLHWKAAWEIPKSSVIYTKKLLPRTIPALTEKTLYPVDIPVTAGVPALSDADATGVFKIMNGEVYSAPLKDQAALLMREDIYARIKPDGNNSGFTMIFDFGAEISGRFELDISAPEGTIVDVCYDESVRKDRLAGRHSYEEYHFTDRYILRQGRQKIGNSILERGFKMVQIVCRNFKDVIEIHQVKAIKSVYPFVQRASFNSDDVLLNQIWNACRETLESCTTDIFTDCPWRERAFWVNDLIVENMTSLQAFGLSEVHRRAFRLAFSNSVEGALLPGVCPCPAGADNLILVPTNLFIILTLKDYLMYSGDRELVKEFMPEIIQILETFSSWEDKNGFIAAPGKYWNFFDWGFELNKISLNGKLTSLLNYLYLMAMKTVLELAKLTGEKIDRDKYRKRITKTSSNLEKHFFKDNVKRLADWIENGECSTHSSQLAHAFALLSGEYSRTSRKYFEDALSDKNILMPELYLHYFVFHAMELCGKEAESLARIRKYWGNIVRTGSPTIWEAGIHEHGKAAFGGDGSLCHGFSTSPIDFLQTVILGIRPLSPGFSVFQVRPRLLDLKFAEGRVPTPHGNIFIRWKLESGRMKVELRVPEGTVAQISEGRSYTAGTHNFKLHIKDTNNAQILSYSRQSRKHLRPVLQ